MGVGFVSQPSHHACKRAMQAPTREDTVEPLLDWHCKEHRMYISTLGNYEGERSQPGSVDLKAGVTSSGKSCFPPDSLYLATGCGFFKPIRRPKWQGTWWPRTMQIQAKVLLIGSHQRLVDISEWRLHVSGWVEMALEGLWAIATVARASIVWSFSQWAVDSQISELSG